MARDRAADDGHAADAIGGGQRDRQGELSALYRAVVAVVLLHEGIGAAQGHRHQLQRWRGRWRVHGRQSPQKQAIDSSAASNRSPWSAAKRARSA
ncbi:potential pseudomonas putida clc transposon [Bordetella bronchiseptica MO211]|nr:potential pseudomonas putida clc transposon [Bordetella bronchiseptica MO211]